MRLAWFVLVLAAAGCSKKSNTEQGTPPGDEWGSGNIQPMHGGGGGMAPAPMGGANPHASGELPPGHPDMGGGGGGQAADLPQLPAPDPNRKMDPAHHIKGMVSVDPKLKDKVKAGTPVFLVAKQVDASGNPSGAPLAVERLEWSDKGIEFTLDEGNAMIAGTELKGDVLVTAHYDTDGEARSKTPGDLLGQTKVTIPADGVKVVLDNLLQ